MVMLTLADILHHIATCGDCAHLKGQTQKFSKALLRQAILSAHAKTNVVA